MCVGMYVCKEGRYVMYRHMYMHVLYGRHTGKGKVRQAGVAEGRCGRQ